MRLILKWWHSVCLRSFFLLEKDFSLALALSWSRASRFLKTINFRHVGGFHVKTSRFYFSIKRRGSRSRVTPTEHHTFLMFSQCANNSLWGYHFYSMDKARYFTTEYVIKIYLNSFLNMFLILNGSE